MDQMTERIAYHVTGGMMLVVALWLCCLPVALFWTMLRKRLTG